MTEYRLTFIVEGKDMATSALGGFGGVLGRIAEFAIGDLLAGGIRRIGEAIGSIAKNAMDAVGHAQNLEMAMEGLLTESLMYQKVIDVQQVAIDLTAAESKKLANLTISREKLVASIQSQEIALAEAARKKNESEDAYQARLNKMRVTLETNKEKLAQYGQEIAGLESKQGRLATMTEASWKQMMSFEDASGQAQGQVKDLLAFIEKLAITSPFETTQVEEVARIGLSAKLSAEGVQEFTKAFLDYSAVHGITSSNLAFAADQFLQLKKIGKLTAIDMRQLRRLGIDVEQILGVKLGMSVEEFNSQVEKSPDLMDKLFDSFIEMAGESSSGAAKRMSLIVSGMMSTVKDVVEIGSRKLFRPIIEAVSPFAADLLGKISDTVTGGKLAEIGKQIGQVLGDSIGYLSEMISGYGLKGLFTQFEDGSSILEGFLMKLGVGEGPAHKFASGLLGVIGMIRELWSWLSTNLPVAIQAVSGFWTDTLLPAITTTWAFLQQNVVPILAVLWDWLGQLLPLAIQIVVDYWTGYLQPALASLGEQWTKIQPALAQFWEWLQIRIPEAIAGLSAAWNAIGKPMFAFFGKVLSEYILPILGDLAVWLLTNIPIAIDATVAFVKNQFIPALQEVWKWIQEKVIPIFVTIWGWLSTNIPAAISTVSDVWTKTLLPAIKGVWAFLDGYIFPYFAKLIELFIAIGSKVAEFVSAYWNNLLLPAYKEAWKFISEKLQPVFDALFRWFNEDIKPIIETVADLIVDRLVKNWNILKEAFEKAKIDILDKIPLVFNDIKDAIKGAIDWIGKLIGKINAIELPDFLTPGSPTPFELGLRGIGEAMRELATIEAPRLQAQFAGMAAGDSSTSYYWQPTIYTSAGADQAMKLNYQEMLAMTGRA